MQRAHSAHTYVFSARCERKRAVRKKKKKKKKKRVRIFFPFFGMFFAFLKGRIPFSGLQTFFPDGKLQNEYTKKVFGFQAVRFRPQKNHQNQIFEGAVFGTPFRGLECIFRGGPNPPGAGLPSWCLTRCDRGASCVRLPSDKARREAH